ncbi:hypothetical protein AK88_00309 [Plasmodium fragile]|uniref:Uncharacterized protein n=1 Tax=Plasmodium fragile TaxID=5857 RepID=A0A0D9QSV8_PLAFR|nr:uncharacterized protein AK88_00309 [Plasmodium fragile]KJP90140.1 hypothetical protein AK88_00309 [Plasmodium fragile]
MNKFSLFINIITIILANNSWSYSNKSAVFIADSWGKNNQVNISDIRAIRSLGEHETCGETEGVKKSHANDEEHYDEDRYNALTQDYFDMMEDDINNNKKSRLTLCEMINNVDPKAQLNYYLGNMKYDDFCPFSSRCRNDLYAGIKRVFRTIDKMVDREMYNILKSKYYVKKNNLFAQDKSMTRMITQFLFKYKIFSPVLVLAFLSIISIKSVAGTAFSTFAAVVGGLISVYLIWKYLKCSKKFKRLPEHFSELSPKEFQQQLERKLDNKQESIFNSTESVDDSTNDLQMS